MNHSTETHEGGGSYPSDFSTMVSQPQYIQRSRIYQGPMPYTARMSRHRSLSRVLYAFWRSNKISYRNPYLIDIIN